MSATAGAPKIFRGVSRDMNQHIVMVISECGNHEALIQRGDVLATSSRPCHINGKGTAQEKDGKWVWTPDHITRNS